MIDQVSRITNVVKDELAKAAVTSGIDKSFVGFVVGPTGPVPIQTPMGNAMVPSWVVTVTLRTELLGMPPIPSPVLVPGPLPQDEDFRGATRQALKAAAEERDRLMNPEPLPPNTIPGELVK